MAAHRVRGAAAGRVVFDRLAADGTQGLSARRAGPAALFRRGADAAERVGDRGAGRRRGRTCDYGRRGHGTRRSRERSRPAADRYGRGRTMGPLPDPGQGGRRRPGRAAGGHRDRRCRRRVRVSLGPTAIHRDPQDRTAGSARHSPHPAHRARCRVRRYSPIRPRGPVAHGQLAGERAPWQPARHAAVDRPGRRRGGADRHVFATAGSGDGGDPTNAARRGSSGAERTAKRRPGRNRHPRRRSTALARRRYRTAAVLPGA